jgi:hypothetical protein
VTTLIALDLSKHRAHLGIARKSERLSRLFRRDAFPDAAFEQRTLQNALELDRAERIADIERSWPERAARIA